LPQNLSLYLSQLLFVVFTGKEVSSKERQQVSQDFIDNFSGISDLHITRLSINGESLPGSQKLAGVLLQ